MRTRNFALLAIAACTSQPALAAPVYLNCRLPDGKGGMAPWSVSLNEEAGTVTFTHPFATRSERASFTPDKVVWSEGDLSIDRTTLVFMRHMHFRGQELSKPEYGDCALSKKKRTI